MLISPQSRLLPQTENEIILQFVGKIVSVGEEKTRSLVIEVLLEVVFVVPGFAFFIFNGVVVEEFH